MYRMEWDDSEMRGRITRLDAESRRAVAAAFSYQASRSTAHMKVNAPWTDQTSAARSGLHAVSQHYGNRFELILAHAVSYGIYLELCNSGRYQIILPSLRLAARELQQLIDGLWGRL